MTLIPNFRTTGAYAALHSPKDSIFFSNPPPMDVLQRCREISSNFV